jgi:hypothetical protein
MNLFAKQSENIIKAFELNQLRAIRLKMLAEQFNQVKHLLSDEEKKDTIEQFRGLGLENPERFISDSPDTTHKSIEEIKSELGLESLKMQIEFLSLSIEEIKNSEKTKRKEYGRVIKATLLGVIVGFGLTAGLEIGKLILQSKHQTNTPVQSKMVLMCDTIVVIQHPDTAK